MAGDSLIRFILAFKLRLCDANFSHSDNFSPQFQVQVSAQEEEGCETFQICLMLLNYALGMHRKAVTLHCATLKTLT